ncbi:tyrosine-type recombinase/integrase, partial [Candidatus Micrarchaeota archaeon]|nr:tyrosine-type recombinase/integrase [Candidatus Micrarchaeota archaeon]
DFINVRSPHTRRFYAYKLRDLDHFSKKSFKEITKSDVKAFLEHKKSKKPRTINGYIAAFKAFFRWLHKLPKHQFPDCVAWLTKFKPEPAIKSRNELLTKDEFRKLLNTTGDARIRCYLVMSLEGIYRKEEIRCMRIKDVIIQDKYALAYSYEKKTHKSNLKPLVFSKPYLLAWLNAHPFKEDEESPLFIPMAPPKKKFVSFGVFNSWIRKLNKVLGLKKRLTPHRLRHMRTSLMLLSGWDKETVRSLGGWTTNQMMHEVYGHVEKEDHARTILSSYGIEVQDDGAGDVKVTTCMVCSHPVSEFEEYCQNCKNVPSLVQAEKEQKKLLNIQREEKNDMTELKNRMTQMEIYVKQKLVEDIVRMIIANKNKRS